MSNDTKLDQNNQAPELGGADVDMSGSKVLKMAAFCNGDRILEKPFGIFGGRMGMAPVDTKPWHEDQIEWPSKYQAKG